MDKGRRNRIIVGVVMAMFMLAILLSIVELFNRGGAEMLALLPVLVLFVPVLVVGFILGILIIKKKEKKIMTLSKPVLLEEDRKNSKMIIGLFLVLVVVSLIIIVVDRLSFRR